ncbi:hypothetical protein [Salipiger sp.]|uniref:hypothetical protein n=1 Tax=Salipiger sp. TaxID=2078585 RepID=UPI003A975CC3
MTTVYQGVRIPPLSGGQGWYCALVEAIRMPGEESPFFEEEDRDSALAVLWICLSAASPAEAEVQLSEHLAECGAFAGNIEHVTRIASAADLPVDSDGAPDAALLEAFRDPDLGDEIVWGEVYLFTEDGR